MAVQLPDELIVEILSILPAKSLLRCRLVCKSWLYLINSTKFKLMHLHNFNQLNPRYLVRRLDFFVFEEWYDVYFDDETLTLDRGTDIEFPFDISRVNCCHRIVGCCNGVVCLCDDDYATSSSDTIILWNPSIRRKLTLTPPMFYSIEFEESYVVLGFGYDKMSDDYKVVRLTCVDCHFIRPQVEVYTVKTGIWRDIMFPNDLSCFFIHYNWTPVFFNGSLHWLASNPGVSVGVSHHSILTFDISTELFEEIQVPEFLAKEFVTVSAIEEYLAVIHCCDLNFDGLKSGSTYLVMVMKEYKNPTSWTTLYYIHYAEVDLGKPLRLRNNGDMIVELENRDMIILNHNEDYYVKVFGDCEEEDSDGTTYVDRYQESLALLDVGDSVPNKEAMEALMKIEKQESGHGPNAAAGHE